MSSGSKMAIKIVCVCAVFLPYKFIYMEGRESSFLQDFLAAMVGYLLAYGVIALISRGNSEE